jgi:hypothetical protein
VWIKRNKRRVGTASLGHLDHRLGTFSLLLVLGGSLVGPALAVGNRSATLATGFANPPGSTRPWVYWFWMNGNETSNGITADLEAMQRVGIGGVLIMDVDQGTPKGPVRFGTPEWRGFFRHTCVEARRLGLQVNLNNDAGWCGSGGPWVTPEFSMQKVVWSETQVNGPLPGVQVLAQPQAFQGFYRDVAVLAFPTPSADDVSMASWSPRFTSSEEPGGARRAIEGASWTAFVLSSPAPGKPAWLQVEFPQPYTARQLSLTMGLSGDQICHGLLQASEDGRDFQNVHEFAAEKRKLILDFPAVTARYFRLLFRHQHPDLQEVVISDLELSPRLRIAHMDGKACFSHLQAYPGPNEFPGRADYPPAPKGSALPRGEVLDLSPLLTADNRLAWDVPPGRWTVLRIGHTSTGTDNHPAPAEGLGLECDKLRKEGVQAVFEGFVGKIARDVKSIAPGTLVSAHVDSWEVDSQNWTENLRAEFRRRRGYELLKFLPVLTGRVIDSFEVSERFLWDFRQTIADLLAENYSGELRRLANRQGLRFSLEGYDAPCDDLTYASKADVPMAEFWTWPPFEMDYTCAEMASVAHVYGKPIAAVEAFTATATERWLAHPFLVKPYADWAFCEGLNQLVIHRYAMQPWIDPSRSPGLSMGPFGLHYERTQTWWDQSGPWHEYLSRCQFLLQQGRYVADFCYLTPENVPQHWKVPFESRARVGYDFDVCSPGALVERISVKHGRLVLPDGMNYRLLVLPESETMTPRLLKKVWELVKAGATVLGHRPLKSPSLSDYPNCDAEVVRLADDLWGKGESSHAGIRPFGKGRVLWGKTPQQVMVEAHVPPDFAPATGGAEVGLRYVHRSLAGAEVYFVSNQKMQRQETVCDFRFAGRRPELWRPDSGRVDHVATYDCLQEITRVPLRLEPAGSVFVIFPAGSPPEPGRLISISRNDQELVGFGPQASEAVSAPEPEELTPRTLSVPEGHPGTFTMAVWAKPDADMPLPIEANTGEGAYTMERNEALFPPPGHEVYGSPEHAGVGLSMGRNGVCVFEHAPFYFAPVLVFAAPLTNWTHIAVVYQDGQPKLYLNGKLVHEGQQSTYIVHSGVGVLHRRGIAPFQGALGQFRGFDRALDGHEVERLVNEMVVPLVPAPFPTIEVVRTQSGESRAQIWQPGVYVAKTAIGGRHRFEVAGLPEPMELTGPWDLSFPPDWGAPDFVTLKQLISWSDHPDAGIRHFSGTATYRKSFGTPAAMLGRDRRVFLDLGKVSVIAQVILNGRDLGIFWKPPFRVDVTDALRSGENVLRVKVVNLWVNRLIGDEALPADSARNSDGTLKQWPTWVEEARPSPAGRYTFSTWPLWNKNEPLRESGLLGPVRLIAAQEVTFR